MRTQVIELLSPRLRERSEIPGGYEPITEPINLNSEVHIIRSIWDGLQGTEFLTTAGKRHMVFWRKANCKRTQ
jgi:hypothetical protein